MDVYARIKPHSHVFDNWSGNKFLSANLDGAMFRRETGGVYRAGPLTTEQISRLQNHVCVTLEFTEHGVPDDPIVLTKGEIAEAAEEQTDNPPAPTPTLANPPSPTLAAPANPPPPPSWIKPPPPPSRKK